MFAFGSSETRGQHLNAAHREIATGTAPRVHRIIRDQMDIPTAPVNQRENATSPGQSAQ